MVSGDYLAEMFFGVGMTSSMDTCSGTGGRFITSGVDA